MHKCVRCGAIYEDNDASILRGCKCGSLFFLLMKTQKDAEEIKQIQQELETKQTTLEQELTKKIEETKAVEMVQEDVKEEVEAVVGQKKKREKGELVKKIEKARKKFGIETLKMPKEGVYEINIDALMKKKPLVILERGKVYIIHLPSAFDT
jgi:predicted  nucleic acid-binding Zn-ribbon protein